MSQQQSPWLEGKYGWSFGESGWNPGMDENLLKFSFMFDGNVDGVVASLPGAVNGQAYFLTTDNRFYFAVGVIWYSTPCPKSFIFKEKSSGNFYQFDGTTASLVDNPAQIDTRITDLEVTVSTLGSAAFQDISFFATESELNIAEANAQAYTDAAAYIKQVQDIATLRLAGSEGRYANDRAKVLGYYSDTPGIGGGDFYWDDTSTETDDGGLVFQVSGIVTGRWKRVFDAVVIPTWYGAKGDDTTDDTAALQALHSNSGIKWVWYPAKPFLISSPIEVVNNGQKIVGAGGQRFSGVRTTVRQATASTVAFQQQASTNWSQEDAFSMYDMEIHSDKGILLNPQTGLIVDGMSATFPYLMRPQFNRLTLKPLTNGLAGSYGIFMVKTFDHIVEQCDFNGHARCLVMNGCDLGRISTNRITNFSEYGILELSASTFGSQNLITNNDIVNATTTTATFYRSTARHVRFVDNYLEEADATCKGFIDLSWESGLDYGSNTSSGMFGTVDVHSNRIDGHALATTFIYRYDPTTSPTFGYGVRIEDLGTNGTAPTLPWLLVTGSTLPIRVGSQGYKQYRLKGGYYTSNANRFTSFETSHVKFANGQVTIDSENLVNCNRGELNRNSAADHVALSDGGFVLATTLGTSLFHVVLPTVGGVLNPYLRSGASIPVKVVARCVSGTQNLDILKVVDAAPQGVTLSTSLDTQFRTISLTFTGVASTSTVGLALSFGATQTNNIVIQSITFG